MVLEEEGSILLGGPSFSGRAAPTAFGRRQGWSTASLPSVGLSQAVVSPPGVGAKLSSMSMTVQVIDMLESLRRSSLHGPSS